MKNIYLNVYVPNKETREKIRKELKRRAGNEDKPIWKIIMQLLKIK
jgi:hypothetical protein